MVVGGSDTSANTIEFALDHIINEPEVMRRVQEELDSVVGRESIVEESHIHKLPYLLDVMKESLRLHPTLPLLVPHCPSETTTVGGYTIPKGFHVFVNVWAIHRDPTIWDYPLKFDPSRFLDDSHLSFYTPKSKPVGHKILLDGSYLRSSYKDNNATTFTRHNFLSIFMKPLHPTFIFVTRSSNFYPTIFHFITT